ncbi:inner membrane transporter RhtA [Saccharopolyspora antimicrobica]|uniref:Inner membrane transporter RhtA n=1 Tax=Saccharopolyspora antimicrobica TaxID=455193 RepID=A0A1I4SKE8_9PSEU|nr:EamA family transporter [Saccharopolyspora antimicrobica]RKT87781.1 inner membrane transporter RhtA [Saccharopolyspora antimicrobica]SFM64988.1 inner membrane transporter RhtA [Saccharopolyspora antimicrobica]
MQSPTPTRRSPVVVPPFLLVLGAVVSVQFGQAFGKQLFAVAGPLGVSALRLSLAAALLLALRRPRIPADRRSRGLIVALGAAIATMNVVYLALPHLPVGVASTLQMLGPLSVALLSSRRPRDVLWAALAAAGVFLFCGPVSAPLPAVGVCLGLVSAAGMGSYLLLSHRVGAISSDGSPLALAVACAAVLVLPFGIAESGAALLSPAVLLAGLGIAVLSAVVPYSLELAALRRIPPRVVGVLQSLEPVTGALAGLLLLAEGLALPQLVALGCVTAASIGAVLGRER